jgi:hypothetical protein
LEFAEDLFEVAENGFSEFGDLVVLDKQKGDFFVEYTREWVLLIGKVMQQREQLLQKVKPQYRGLIPNALLHIIHNIPNQIQRLLNMHRIPLPNLHQQLYARHPHLHTIPIITIRSFLRLFDPVIQRPTIEQFFGAELGLDE